MRRKDQLCAIRVLDLVTFAAGSGPARFVIQRLQSNAGATVPLIVEDDCGDWATFAGGGAAAF